MACGGGGGGGCGGGGSRGSSDEKDDDDEVKGPCNRDLLAVDNPNFSIVTKAGCNGSCSFCFQNRAVTPHPKYMGMLEHTLKNLPGEFQRCSITGGEPTIDPDLPAMLGMLGDRFNRIVLNTNGAKLLDLLCMKEFKDNVTHVNFSRHAVSQGDNDSIMGFASMKVQVLTNIADRLSQLGIDMTLNRVVDQNTTRDEILDYIKMAKDVGATAVCFRKLTTASSDLSPVNAEKAFASWVVLKHDECPACRTDVRLISGMPSIWKAGCMEPMDKMDLIYELIFQQDGRLTADWAGTKEMKVHKGYLITPKMMEMIDIRKQMRDLEQRQKDLDVEQRRLKQQARLMKNPKLLAGKL